VHLKKILSRAEAQSSQSSQRKNLSVSASLRDKKYDEQEFFIGAYSGGNAVKSLLRSC
jgi:hypothetical protein